MLGSGKVTGKDLYKFSHLYSVRTTTEWIAHDRDEAPQRKIITEMASQLGRRRHRPTVIHRQQAPAIELVVTDLSMSLLKQLT